MYCIMNIISRKDGITNLIFYILAMLIAGSVGILGLYNVFHNLIILMDAAWSFINVMEYSIGAVLAMIGYSLCAGITRLYLRHLREHN